MNRNILYAFILNAIGQALVWFQSNGQFMWPWFKKNSLIIALTGIPISFMFILSTRLNYAGFGVLWPGRMIGFAIGVIIFSILSRYFMGEMINLKTGLCLLLAAGIICIQLFMK